MLLTRSCLHNLWIIMWVLSLGRLIWTSLVQVSGDDGSHIVGLETEQNNEIRNMHINFIICYEANKWEQLSTEVTVLGSVDLVQVYRGSSALHGTQKFKKQAYRRSTFAYITRGMFVQDYLLLLEWNIQKPKSNEKKMTIEDINGNTHLRDGILHRYRNIDGLYD